MTVRKQYAKPQVKKYGDIRKLTLVNPKGPRENPRGPNPPTTKTGF